MSSRESRLGGKVHGSCREALQPDGDQEGMLAPMARRKRRLWAGTARAASWGTLTKQFRRNSETSVERELL